MFCIVRIVLHGRTVLVLRSDNTIIVSRYLCMFVTRYPRLRLRAVPGRSAALLRTPYLNCHFFFAGSIIAREADGPAKKSENFGKALSYRNDNTRSLTFNYFARYINNSSHLTPTSTSSTRHHSPYLMHAYPPRPAQPCLVSKNCNAPLTSQKRGPFPTAP